MAKGNSSSGEIQNWEGARGSMRNPLVVLANLAKHSSEENYKYTKLYRNLYNAEFYYMAYQKIDAKPGNMTQGTDEKTIDGMSLEKIENLIAKLKDQSYQPNPVRRVNIPKKNGKTRPLGIPSFEDKLVQEVIRMILENIYEGSFEDTSHGFRPNKSCHTAIMQIQKRQSGVRWFIEGDIESFFDNIEHHTLIKLLRKRIEDEKFINLIWKFLKAGFVDDWKWHKSYSGTPQGGIISPVLSNIYLHELDKYMKVYKERYEIGTKRKHSKEYINVAALIRHYKKRVNQVGMTTEKGQMYLEKVKELKRKLKSIPSKDELDKNFKRMHYTRYADDFLIGVIGSKEDAQEIKMNLTKFLKEELNLNLSQEKTLITNTTKKARFLGYDITTERSKDYTVTQNNGIKARQNRHIKLYVPKEKWEGKLKELGVLEITKEGQWKGKARPQLQHNDDIEILMQYNAEISGLYNYYRLANNASVMHKFCYIMEQSMLKTFASKYRTKVSKIWNRFSQDGRFRIKYETKKGVKYGYFIDKVFVKNQTIKKQNSNIDKQPTTEIFTARTSLVDRLKAEKCEWCGSNEKLEMHHVRKLKDLKGKALWEKHMIERQRKTIALCASCHVKLHNGKLD